MPHWVWYDVYEGPDVRWWPQIGVDGAHWCHIGTWRLVAVGWLEGGQITNMPYHHFIFVDSSSEKHSILIRSATKLCVMIFRSRIDDVGVEIWHNRRQLPLPARGVVVVPVSLGT